MCHVQMICGQIILDIRVTRYIIWIVWMCCRVIIVTVNSSLDSLGESSNIFTYVMTKLLVSFLPYNEYVAVDTANLDDRVVRFDTVMTARSYSLYQLWQHSNLWPVYQWSHWNLVPCMWVYRLKSNGHEIIRSSDIRWRIVVRCRKARKG